MRIVVITEPTFEPVSLPEARRQLRLGELIDDDHVEELIPVARARVEDISSVALASRTVKATFGDSEELVLPLGAVDAVTSVRYLDADGVEQTAAGSAYRVNTGGTLSVVEWVEGEEPTLFASSDAVRVTYVVGYADAASVPPALKQAVLLVLADLYEMRVPQAATLTSVEALVAPWVLS